MSSSRRPGRSWRRLALVAVFAVVPIYGVLLILALVFVAPFGEWFDSLDIPDALGELLVYSALFGPAAALTGLVTARAARFHRRWRLVPAATACAAVLVPILVLRAAGWQGDFGIPVMWPVMSLGALAGVALVDHLTRDEGQGGDVGEPHPTQEDSPVG